MRYTHYHHGFKAIIFILAIDFNSRNWYQEKRENKRPLLNEAEYYR